MVKVTISYDMQEGREKEAQEYLVNKLAPGLARLGFRVSDVLYTVWGNSPQITSAGELEDLETARTIFHSSEWQTLALGMDELTTNLNVRLMRSNN
ncbi:MAG: hypothetical protein WDZ49_08365 [Litorilinea sp.]